MPQNDFLPVATQGTPNVQPQVDYAGSQQQEEGYQIGEVPSSSSWNKMMRQASSIAAVVATFLVNATGLAMIDDGDIAGKAAIMQSAFRLKLLADTTFFIATTGSDSTGDGSVGNPWRTAQHAVNLLASSYDMNGHIVTIQRADGNYTDAVVVNGQLVGQTGAASLIFSGNAVTPANVKVTVANGQCYNSTYGAVFTIQNQQLKTTGSGSGLNASFGSGIVYANMRFDACASSYISASNNSWIQASGATPFTAIANANSASSIHVVGNSNHLATTGQTFTWTGPITYSVCNVIVSTGGSVDFGASATGQATIASSGVITGTKYIAQVNGTINSNGQGAGYLPGTGAGTTATGGQYV